MNSVLELVRPHAEHEAEVMAYRAETFAVGEMHINGGGGLDEYSDYAEWMRHNEDGMDEAKLKPGYVKGETLLGVRKADGRVVGLINIRYTLTDRLLLTCGHIGYSVRPSERRKGYALEMLEKGCKILSETGVKRVLVTCAETNEASRRTILAGGGKFENKLYDEEDGEMMERYWIDV